MLIAGCGKQEPAQTADGPAAADVMTAEQATQLQAEIKTFCGACHQVPAAEMFAQEAWYKEVNRGYDFYVDSGRNDLIPPPLAQVVDWYRQRAPETLPRPEPLPSAPGDLRFQSQSIPTTDGAAPMIAEILWDGELRLCDMANGLVTGVDPNDIQPQAVCKVLNACRSRRIDLDGDSIPDLLVSDVTGYHSFFRNAGGANPPRFEAPRHLTFEGKPLKTVWRVRPAVVDWMGDGRLHYLCLDEDGVLSDFRRLSDTELGDKRHPRWEDGQAIRFTMDVGGGRGRAKLCVCDWTGDGRLDLIVGTHARASVPPGPSGAPRNTTGQAGIFLLENVGSNAEPVFALPKAFSFRGETIAMGMHVASPEAVDWTGTGALGLLVGIEDGSIVWLPREDLSW